MSGMDEHISGGDLALPLLADLSMEVFL